MDEEAPYVKAPFFRLEMHAWQRQGGEGGGAVVNARRLASDERDCDGAEYADCPMMFCDLWKVETALAALVDAPSAGLATRRARWPRATLTAPRIIVVARVVL
jgi:hypothetical protein